MKIIKHGAHRLFESDVQTTRIVCEMLLDLERQGMDAVRKYSTKFDGWNPESFELTASQVDEATATLPTQVISDTASPTTPPTRRSSPATCSGRPSTIPTAASA